MSLVLWIGVGAAVGLLADLLAREYGLLEDVIVGVAGAIVAGWIFTILTEGSMTSVGPLQAVSALLGALGLIGLSRTITRKRGVI